MEHFKAFISSKMGVILTLIFISVLFFYVGRKTTKSDKIIIYNDSIQVLKNQKNELYSRVDTYEITVGELKAANSQLFQEVRKFKDKSLTAQTVGTKIEYKDSLTTKIVINKKNDFTLNWSKDTIFSKGNSLKLEGSTALKTDSVGNPTYFKSTLTSLKIASKLYFIQTEKDGKIYLNARTDYPNLTFTEMESYVVNPLPTKPKRIGLGLILGVDYKGTLTVGAGISYNIFNF